MIFKTTSLPPHVLEIVHNKGTERPFTGEYNELNQPGTYLCRQCGLALYHARAKFHSACGWPSFDEEVAGAVKRQLDADGLRIEIVCTRCNAHLGHVFSGEGFTAKNIRHCVNSMSLDFVADLNVIDTEEAIFAAGCFWGVEYYLQKLPGVLKTEVGYSGGNQQYPSYEEICKGTTGHFEAIRVLYDPAKISFEKLTQYFFEIHDPTQMNGQGPDLGQQYLSAIFYYNETQEKIAYRLIAELEKQGLQITTQVLPVKIFWQAEAYHQGYYAKTGKNPYCHRYVKRFG